MRTVVFSLLLLVPLAAHAVSEEEAARVTSKLSDQLKSPFCPGKTLLTCTSGQAYDLRQEIKALLVEGKSVDEVVEALELRYGNEITNPPQPWYTFFVPFLPWVVGILLVGWVLRRWLKASKTDDGGESPPVVAGGPDAERLARLRARVAQEE